MEAADLRRHASDYDRDGYLSPVRIIGADEAAGHRRHLEDAEAQIGPLHYKAKVHTILRSAWDLASHPEAVDVVESLIGPDILVYNVTYIIKEPGSRSHVSWHQDLTYWGFDRDDQVSMWLALSPATEETGCMRMIPGSHKQGTFDHETGEDADNVLLQAQTVKDVDESSSRHCRLDPGEATFHHGWTLHASMPNRGSDRRIGINVQYIAPQMRQTKHDRDSTVLVRGEDRYGHFGTDTPAESDLETAALQKFRDLNRLYRETAGTA